MTSCRARIDRIIAPTFLALALAAVPLWADASEEPKFVVDKVAEKELATLPSGAPLFWHVETFASIEDARAAATDSSVPAEVAGKAWLLTLGPDGTGDNGGEKLASIGPVDRFEAPRYLLRINISNAPAGTVTSIHSHPGSEAIYVLSGEATIRWPGRTEVVGAGDFLAGEKPDTPMEAKSTGSEDLVELIMFVVDASKPFSAPAAFD